MPDIVIENLNNIRLSSDLNAKNVLEIILNNYIDWMHACGSKGRCTTCKMQVIRGIQNLSPLSKFELQYQHQNKLAFNERLSCQAVLLGDITVRVPEECKLPHVNYSF